MKKRTQVQREDTNIGYTRAHTHTHIMYNNVALDGVSYGDMPAEKYGMHISL